MFAPARQPKVTGLATRTTCLACSTPITPVPGTMFCSTRCMADYNGPEFCEQNGRCFTYLQPLDACTCLSAGVCPDCRQEYSYCACSEPGADELAAIQWEPAIGVITDLGAFIDRLNAQHNAACAAAPSPYRPLGSLLCRVCGNELANCVCFDGDDLPF